MAANQKTPIRAKSTSGGAKKKVSKEVALPLAQKLPKRERVRDPLHNLIEFGTEQIEHVLWQVIQTEPFQRLRRIKQLGFSELVYPGATHTRFAHSVGVFHTARHLMRIIERHLRSSQGHHFQDHQAHVALAAALVHDLGHGMFSHAFEDVGKKLKLPMAQHEHVSDILIRDSEVAAAFAPMGSGFANDVAAVIKRRGPGNLYDAVVSSQFDADRLDYMQRDRLMTGLQNGGIDFIWLMANLEVGKIPTGVDEEALGEVPTFILGPKAYYAAESYVLSLFQLYPTIYFHKTTRAAEKIFSALLLRIIELARGDDTKRTGLLKNHPIIRFALNPDSLNNALTLDDTVFWGALPLLVDAQDEVIRDCAKRLYERRLPKCIDVRHRLVSAVELSPSTPAKEKLEKKKELDRLTVAIRAKLDAWARKNSNGAPRILTDHATRDPYKRFEESKGPLNQIHIRLEDGKIHDVAACSPVIAAIESFEFFRAYYCDNDAAQQVNQIVEAELRRVR